MGRDIELPDMLSGASSAFVESLYDRYTADPQSVDESWRGYFDRLEKGASEAARSPLGRARIGPIMVPMI
ncbi:hypothetical protein JCM17845_23460 [Iodidimonas gelatinilytica]|uniref:2-oxoglutarate dehydrogenase E1 component N-terminal domain-containing protein n=1 Tax=Iodidimonas gelatinilytica TaxID=1236966 RepID=A0A5A7N0D8_9PROT|nr:hypothetical protein [Iodidimonas gelatinilytica]GER01723.1 hypothetical protein JCM17845_23460 [Iodidimonas gelatinilytica]